MRRKLPRVVPPAQPALTARCTHTDIDPRSVAVDPTFAATLQTRHQQRFTVTLDTTDHGPDEFTRDVPNVGEEALADLDDAGLIRPGSAVRPGAILVGKITPLGDQPLTPEELLLKAIFGEKVGPTRDTSLRAPPRCFAEVLEASIDGDRADVLVAWDRPLEVGDVLLVDDEPRTVAALRPLLADITCAAACDPVSVVKTAIARDALMARSIGPYELLSDQPVRDGHAGQVVTAEAIAALATAAPWAAWELLTLKSDSAGTRSRMYEALVKRERPDVTPRTTGSHQGPRGGSLHHDIFSFFATPPAPDPGHVAASQPEIVGLIALHLRALGLDIDLSQHHPGVSLLTSAKIRETSHGHIRSPEDLASQQIFGPLADYKCACGKHTRMRDRGVVCDVCNVEVIQSRVRRQRCGHLELPAACTHPLLSGAPRRRRGRTRSQPIVTDHEPLHTIVVLPAALRDPQLDAAYTRVLTADVESLQSAVDQLFAALAEIVDTGLHPRMYSKAVDHSGAAHLVVDETLAADECRVPPELLRELWRPHAYGLLETYGYATTIRNAKRMLEQAQPEALTLVTEASEGSTVLLVAGSTIVARRVRAWHAPAIGVDPTTADLLAARTVSLHVPLSHQAALEISEMSDDPRPATSRSTGWLAQARRDGRLVDAAVHAALSGEPDPIDDIVVHIALGRAPDPIDDAALGRWQAADEARQQALHTSLAPAAAEPTQTTDAMLGRSVDELELSVRTANALAALGILTLRDLCARSESDLLRSRNFGRKSLKEIQEILHALGLSLA